MTTESKEQVLSKEKPDTNDNAASSKTNEQNDHDDENFQQERKIKSWRWAVVIGSIYSSITLYSLDNTIVADIQPDIIEAFGELDKLSWLSVAFLVACVSTVSIWGKIYDQLNAKWLYLTSVVLFEVGSALCGGAPTMDALIVGRVIAGLGGVGLYIGVMTLVSVNTTKQERPLYIGMAGLTWGIGTVCGPIVGGGFAVSSVGWRWAFYINLLFAAVAVPVYVFMIPSFDPRPGVSYKTRFQQLDYLGTTLMVGASIAGVMAINFGGRIYPWDSGQTIALFVVSGVLFVIFAWQQWNCVLTTLKNRTFPCQFLKRLSFLNLFIQTASVGTTYFVPIYFVPLFFQLTRGDSAIDAGVRLLPLISLIAAGQIFHGIAMPRSGYYMPWYVTGSCISLVASVLMYTVKLSTPESNIYGFTTMLGLGAGIYAQAGFSVAQAKAKPSEIPVATGFISLAQLTGGTISLAIANAVFLQKATDGILAIIPTASPETVQNAITNAHSDFLTSLTGDQRNAVLEALTNAMSKVYILSIVAAAMSVTLSLLLPREKLFEKSQTTLAAGGA